MTDGEEILARYRELQASLREAAKPWGEPVAILPVTKTVPAERVLCLKDAGVSAIGENRVQEAMDKLEGLGGAFSVHIIGRMQTNKAKYAARFASMVQSLDRLMLAQALETALERENRQMDALVEVNVAGDPAKAGVSEADAPDFLRALARYPHLRVRGLMTVAPIVSDPELAASCFRRTRALFDRLREEAPGGAKMEILSMGMSADCLVAAREGATLVRVGSALFGKRA